MQRFTPLQTERTTPSETSGGAGHHAYTKDGAKASRFGTGFTLIETMIAVMVLSIAMIGPLTLSQKSLSTARVSKEQVNAFYLAQDAIEYVKNIRDSNQKAGRPWLTSLSECIDQNCSVDSTQDTPAQGIVTDSESDCTPLRYDAALNNYGCNPTWSVSPYTRVVRVESGDDPLREATIRVTVSWTAGSFTRTYEAALNIYNVANAIQVRADQETGGTGATTLPTCTMFTATPSTISPGEDSNLTWSTNNGTVSFNPSIGNTDTINTNYPVTPTITTTYILTVSNSAGIDQCQATVTVGAAEETGSPEAYWPFNTNGTDITGNSHNATLVGGAPIVTGASAKIGAGALGLDGVDDAATVPDHVLLRGNQNLSISLWFRTTASTFQKLITKSSNSTSKDWELGIDMATGHIGWESEIAGSGYALDSAVGLVSLNTWYHYVAVLDKTNNTLKLYLNGNLVAQDTTFGNNSDATAAAISIGKRMYGSGGSSYTQGAIDDVQIFNRALAVSEISALYSAGGAPTVDTTPPVISNAAPSGTLAGGTTQTNMTVTTNENATCKWNTTDVTYASMANTFTTTGGTSHSYTLTGLTNGSSYTRYVRCIDPSSNPTSASTIVNFSVAIPVVDVTAGLVAYWPFDGNAVDASGNGYHGTLANGAIIGSTARIGSGSALLDGVDDYITTGDITALNSKSAFTLSGWFRDPVPASASGRFTAGKYIDSNNRASQGANANEWYVNVTPGTSYTYGKWTGYGATIPADTWFHAAMVFDGTQTGNANRLKLYINNVARTLSFSGTIPATTANFAGVPFRIGSQTTTAGFWNGYIDEMRVYDRALTPAEITSIYNYTGGGVDVTPPVMSSAAPSGTLAAGTTQVNMTVTTNESATCRWSTTDVAYSAMPNTFTSTGFSNHSYTLLGLTNGSSYTRYIRCSDPSGNPSTASTVVFFTVASSGGTVPTSGLVAYWPFDTNANDTSGQGNNGTFTNGAAITTTNKQVGAGAATFDGVDDYMTVADAPELDMGPNDWSIAFWQKTNYSGTPEIRILQKGAGTSKEYEVGLYTPNKSLYVETKNGSSGEWAQTGSNTYALNTWQHIVVMMDVSANMQPIMYVNGVQKTVTSDGITSVPTATVGTLYVGSRNSAGLFFPGQLDELRLYNRLLTAAEITALYNYTGTGGDTTPPVISNPAPSGTLAAGNTQTTMTVTTNEPATCKWNATDVAYASMANTFTTTGNTSHSYLLTGLTDGSSYTRYIRCQDTAGNPTTASTVVSFSVGSGGNTLVAHWPFDTNMTDVSASNYDGTAAGNASISTASKIIGAGALTLDGSGDYVNTVDIPELNNVTKFSISGWFRDPIPATATGRYNFAKFLNTNNKVSSGSNANEYYVNLPTGSTNAYGVWPQYGATIPANTWYHAVMVFDGTQTGNANRLKLYVNNVERTLAYTGTIPAITPNIAGTTFLIGTNSTGANYWTGGIDDLRVYNYALTPANVSTLYAMGGADGTPPVISASSPSGTLAAGTTQSNLTVTTNEAATCKWNSTDVSYISMVNTFTTTGGTSHSYLLTGLTDGNSYTRYVRCQDTSGNPMVVSEVVSFSVASAGNNLIAHWPFDSNLTDATANNFDGTAAGNAAISSATKIIGTGSLLLDGTGDYVSVADIPALNVAQKFSVSGWFRDPAPGSATGRYTFGKYSDVNNKISSGANANEFWVNVPTGGANTNGVWPQYGATIAANAWFHAVMVFDGTQTGNANRLKLYVNDVERPLTFAGTIPAATPNLAGIPFLIGTNTTGAGHWNGYIDDLRVYNYALSPANVTTLYDMGITDTTPPVISSPAPSGTLAAGTTQVNMTVSTNEAATCKWAVSDMTYSAMPNTFTTTGGSNHSYTLLGLTNGTAYTRYIRCQDNAANPSTASTVVSFSVAAGSSATLIAHWPLDTNANSVVGTGLNGTLTGNAAISATTPKVGAGSATFDGTGDWISVPANAALDITGAMSVSGWVKTSDPTITRTVVSRNTGAASRGYALSTRAGSVAAFNISGDCANEPTVLGTTVLPTNTWVHLVGIYEPSTAVRIYVNGVLENSNTASIPATQCSAGQALGIGGRPPSATQPLIGNVDDVRIYTGILSQADINALYALGSGGDTTPPVISSPAPSGTLAAGTTQTNMTVTTNENATCKWNTTDVAYASMANTFTTTGATSHSYTLTGLTNGTAYTRYIRCQDASGNPTTASTVVSFSVATAGALIAHMPFDSGVNASVGGFTGTAVGNAAIATGIKAVGAGSLQLDGSGDYVTYGDILDMTAAQSFSISVWARPAISNGATTWRILAKKNSGTAPQLGYMLAFGTSQEFSGVLDDGVISVTRAGAINNPVSVWKHAVLVVNRSTQQVTMYTDGVASAASSISSVGSLSSALTFTLGSGSNPGNYFNGNIDDLRVYDYALTQTDVNNLFALGTIDSTPPTISASGPTGTLTAGTTQVNMTATTNENATCKWSAVDEAFSAMPNTFTTTGATSHSYTLLGLTNGTAYTRYIRCQDASGNPMTASEVVSFSVATGNALIAHWPFDSNMTDSTSNNYDGTVAGNAAITTATKIVGAGALTLDGTGDYVNTADIPDLDSADAFTVSGWFRDAVPASATGRYAFGKWSASNIENSAGANANEFYVNLRPGTSIYGKWTGYGGAIPANTWYHAVMVYDGTQTGNAARLKLYVNNVLQTLTFTGTIPATGADLGTAPFRIGTQQTGAGYWNGQIDDLRVYNYALTTGEITTLYNMGDFTAPTISASGPSGTLAAGTTQVNLTATTNENATCKWSTTDQAYSAMPNTFTTTGATSHSYNLTGLTNGTAYTRYIRCQDASGNAMGASTVVNFSVATAGPAGLTAHWKFNEASGNATDVVNGFVATQQMTIPRIAGPNDGNAADLNGTANSFYSVPDNATLDLVAGITITAWVRPNDKTIDSFIVTKKCFAGDNGYHLRTNTRIRFEWGNASTQTDFDLSTANIMVDDVWQHVAVTYDEATVKFYRNGVAQGSIAHAGTMAASTEPLSIGAASCGAGGRADTDIDGVRIYDHALTAAEITQIYTDGS